MSVGYVKQVTASHVDGTQGEGVVVVVVVVVVGQVESSSHTALNPAPVVSLSLWNLITILLLPLPQLVMVSGTMSPQNFSLYDP